MAGDLDAILECKRNLSAKKPGERLSILEKREVCKLLARGIRQCVLVSELGLTKSVLSRIWSDKENLLSPSNSASYSSNLNSKKRQNRSEHPELDEAVYKWFVQTLHPDGRCKPLPLSRAIIQAYAKKVADGMKIRNFSASDGWFSRWRWRHNIGKSVKLLGEAGEVNLVNS